MSEGATPSQAVAGVRPDTGRGTRFLSNTAAALAAAGAVAAFHLAFAWRETAFLIAGYLACMSLLAWARSTRVAFYVGLAVGAATWGPQLAFFANVFSYAAVGLWLAVSLGTALFLLMSRSCAGAMRRPWALAAIPVIWTGWGYVRGELNPLRFTWLNAGQAFAGSPWSLGLDALGVYGAAFAILAVISVLMLFPRGVGLPIGAALLAVLAAMTNLIPPPGAGADRPADGPFVVAVQLELPSESEVLTSLNRALERYPQADLMALSEFTFHGPIPPRVRDWCREHQRYLVAGGTAPAEGDAPGAFRNMAFVVGPDGNVVFTQAKSVPVQFFDDGLPAESRRVWPSPWGPVAVCICYDLGYSRVMDDFIRQGAGAILCIVLDKVSWGRQEHVLHSRVGPVRAAEHRVGVLRACSSGISQLIRPGGAVEASAGFPGRGEMVAGRLVVGRGGGRLPLDRWLAPACVAVMCVLAAALVGRQAWVRLRGPNRNVHTTG